MKKIESLTEEQNAKFPEYVKRWIEIGLSTNNPDRSISEAAIRKVYQCGGLEEPKTFIWVESPLHAGACYAILKDKNLDSVWASVGDSVRNSVWNSVGDSVRDSVRDSVWDSVGNSVRDSVWNSVWASVGDSVRNSVWNSVGDSVRNSVWNSVGDSVRDSVRDSVWDSVRDSVRDSVGNSVWNSVWNSVGDSVRNSVGNSVRDSVWNSVGNSVRDSVWNSVGNSVWNSVRASCYGSHEVGWLSYYKYMNDELKIDCSRLNGLWEASENCGWFIPFKDIVIVSPKPFNIRTKLNTIGNHILHADGEPAVFYCNDFKIYAREGVRIPEKYGAIKSENWKPEWFLEETNVEIKRVIAEAIGYEKLFSAINAKEISSHREYKLFRAENVDIEPMHILTMVCPSTGKTHYGRVPPEITQAREAATWRNQGIEPESFLIEQ